MAIYLGLRTCFETDLLLIVGTIQTRFTTF